MSTEKGEGKLTLAEAEELVDRVKILIERCIARNLNPQEVIDDVYENHKIERFITETIWENLEKQNREFFNNYYSKLILKELHKVQAEMMNQSPLISDHGASYLLEKLSTQEDRKKEEKQRVQNLIKQYLVHYTSQKQVIDMLYQTEKIEPSFTLAVWEELEQEDPVFFKNYYSKDLADQHSSSAPPATDNQQPDSSSG